MLGEPTTPEDPVPNVKFPALSTSCVTLLIAAALGQASVEYRAKADGTCLYSKETLDPPPLAALEQGESVTLELRGSDRSLVVTRSGLKGWIRNCDLTAVRLAEGGRHSLREQKVTSDDRPISPWIPGMAPPVIEVQDIDRSFSGEITEVIDREQTEMRHDEN
jgi:hypothetical protein